MILAGSTLSVLSLGVFTTISSGTNLVHAAIPSWMKSAFFKIISSVGNSTYNVNAGVTSGQYGETITPGSIAFNGSTYGAEVAYSINALSTNHSVALYASTSPVNWGKSISVILRDPYGNRLINRSVNSGQWSGVSFSTTGTHEASFVSNTSTTWAPYIAYRYDKGYNIYGRSATPIVSEEPYEATSDYGNLITPAWNEDSNGILENNFQSLSVKELNAQMLDDGGNYVYSLRDFNVNDIISFSDTIQDSQYNSESNETTFIFDLNSKEDNALKFSGDLTSVYSSGDILNLKFTVINLSNDSDTFAVPNYYKYLIDNDGQAPTIDEYISMN